jgi:hypothetical protein
VKAEGVDAKGLLILRMPGQTSLNRSPSIVQAPFTFVPRQPG